MMSRLLAFALMLSACMTTPVSSQTAEQQMFLQANPGLAQQLQRQVGAQKNSGTSEGAGVVMHALSIRAKVKRRGIIFSKPFG